MNGLVLVDKPKGWTSHDVVGKMRKLAGTKKVGHTGTLDPDATGLLPITIGFCTKLAQYLILDSKSYDFTMKLGAQTDTDDSTGQIIETSDWSHVTEAQLQTALGPYQGEVMQRPPKYSAIKINGQRAYSLARQGIEFELPERPVHIESLTLNHTDLPDCALHLSCGSGTYVRSIVRDLGLALGTHAHTTSIRRTRVGAFMIEQAATLEQLEAQGVASFLLPPHLMVAAMPSWTASAEQVDALGFGRPLTVDVTYPEGEMVAILSEEGKLLALTKSVITQGGNAILQPKRVLFTH